MLRIESDDFFRWRAAALPVVLLAALVLSGCRSLAPEYEKEERAAVAGVARGLGVLEGDRAEQVGSQEAANRNATLKRNDGAALQAAVLPDAAATPDDYVRFALLNHPKVRAAFFRWWAQAEAITPARSLPDPMLTFEMDISNIVTSVMPGLMMDIPGWGKLEAAGKEAAAASRVAYAEYSGTLYDTARAVRAAWAQLYYIETVLQLGETSSAVLRQSAAIAQADYGTGAADSFEMQNEIHTAAEGVALDLATLRRERTAARIAFKASLGLLPTDADPLWPSVALPLAELPEEGAIWERLLVANPRLAVMRSAVDAAVRATSLAAKTSVPDFSVGLMSDVKMNPVMYRPQFAMSLPIWRDKIESIIASADAQAHAALEDMYATELELAATLAQGLYRLQEAQSRLAYLEAYALPNLERTRLSADAQYRSGSGGFATLSRLHLQEQQTRIAVAAAQRDAALAHTEIAHLVASAIPDRGLLRE